MQEKRRQKQERKKERERFWLEISKENEEIALQQKKKQKQEKKKERESFWEKWREKKQLIFYIYKGNQEHIKNHSKTDFKKILRLKAPWDKTPIDCMDNIISYLEYYEHGALFYSRCFGNLEWFYEFKKVYANRHGPGNDGFKNGLTRFAVCNQCGEIYPRRPIANLSYCDFCYDWKPSKELLEIKKPGQMHGNTCMYGIPY